MIKQVTKVGGQPIDAISLGNFGMKGEESVRKGHRFANGENRISFFDAFLKIMQKP